MIPLPPFEVERWMNEYEVRPNILNLAETCVASVSLTELANLAGLNDARSIVDVNTILDYGTIRGSESLRENVVELHGGPSIVGIDNVLITQGAIAANFQVLCTLIDPGDHVICVSPTYQQLYSFPKALGAEVTLWKLKADLGYMPDVTELEQLVTPKTSMIIINNPNNPIGASIPIGLLKQIASFAEERHIIVLSDEVYRPLYHDLVYGAGNMEPSIILSGYDNVIATGSMSKAYAMAGIRIGWIVSTNKGIIEALASTRDYTTISVSKIDDRIASYALSEPVRRPLLERNVLLAKTNVDALATFVLAHSHMCSWVKPKAGTTAFVQFKFKGQPIDDVEFCKDLIERFNVMLVPGSLCFGDEFKGYVRFGYACRSEVLTTGLQGLKEYLRNRTRFGTW